MEMGKFRDDSSRYHAIFCRSFDSFTGQLLFDGTKSYIEISTIASPISWLFVYTSCPLKLLDASMLTVEVFPVVHPVS